jgi:hypothetical protein
MAGMLAEQMANWMVVRKAMQMVEQTVDMTAVKKVATMESWLVAMLVEMMAAKKVEMTAEEKVEMTA